MFTLLYNHQPLYDKIIRKGEGSVKKGQNLVHVVYECPLSLKAPSKFLFWVFQCLS